MSITVVFTLLFIIMQLHLILMLGIVTFGAQQKKASSNHCSVSQVYQDPTERDMQIIQPHSDFGKLWCAYHWIGLLQVPPPCILVVVSTGVSLCIAVSCTEVVSTSEGRKWNVKRFRNFTMWLDPGIYKKYVDFVHSFLWALYLRVHSSCCISKQQAQSSV